MAGHAKPELIHYVGMADASDFLGVNERTVRRYVADGRLRAYRVGPSRVRFRVGDLQAMLKPIPAADVVS